MDYLFVDLLLGEDLACERGIRIFFFIGFVYAAVRARAQRFAIVDEVLLIN